MTATTIKVDTALRDRLKAQAASEGLSLGEHIERLVQREERRLRMARLRAEIAAASPDALASYARETAELDAALASSGLE
ncbi:ribbon-helix-helix protein [Microbacterium album]|uniref:Uncharacterized protein n=1 Tax=Microbacterium album TaxID=2053191 RepID=A0A917IFU3_9MICO|nr:hypothetical protein [Microbacterium album]GGH42173.1 hypothetical protein GCM10010921_15210 [Microbacterium album]